MHAHPSCVWSCASDVHPSSALACQINGGRGPLARFLVYSQNPNQLQTGRLVLHGNSPLPLLPHIDKSCLNCSFQPFVGLAPCSSTPLSPSYPPFSSSLGQRKDMRGICSGTFLGIQLHNHWKLSFPFSWKKSDLFN